MKFLALALIGTASANISEEELFVQAADSVGTPCTKASDTCGDADKMCCGLALDGEVL